jgi:hypothetical protein
MRAEHPKKGKRIRNQRARQEYYGLHGQPGAGPIRCPDQSAQASRLALAAMQAEALRAAVAKAGRYDCTWKRAGSTVWVSLKLRDGSTIKFYREKQC